MERRAKINIMHNIRMQQSWLLSRFLLTQKDVPSLRFAQTAMQLMRMLCVHKDKGHRIFINEYRYELC